MILLILLAIAQLVVLVMVLAAATAPKLEPLSEQNRGRDDIDRIHRQTIDDMYASADDETIDSFGHDAY
jgi:hypothetical protein